ncbi:MAG: hypothetical protein ACJ8AW_39685, partial [Rhodopila sp.]
YQPVNYGVHNVTTSPATPEESAPTEPRGATIIPFPVRPPAPSPAGSPPLAESASAEPTPADRLARALANLNAALAEQRAAVATWRSVMSDLKKSTAGLGDSLHRYNASLGALGDKVAGLNKQARELEEWADCNMATHGATHGASHGTPHGSADKAESH